MKKLIFSLAAALLLLAGCETGPKTHNWKDLSFTYPASYTLSEEDSDSHSCTLLLSKDDDNFMVITLIALDEDLIQELERSEIQENVEGDALDMLMLDVDDENMDVDKESISVLSSPEGSAPGVLISYDGTYFDDPFLGRISATVLRNYEILLKYEATGKKALDEMTDIATSFEIN